MELRHLRYFLAVAEERHFRRAAERVFVTQPTLSQGIGTFESELGAALFDRSNRKVRLTPVGEVLLPHARRVVEAAERAEAAVRAAAEGRAGTLRIGYEPAVMRDGLPQALRAFREDVPDVSLDLIEIEGHVQADRLRDNDLDVGMLLLPVEAVHLVVEPLFSRGVSVVMPDDHPLAASDTIRLADLAGVPHVAWSQEAAPQTYAQFHLACEAAGFVPEIAEDVRQAESLLGLVAAGVGIGLLHESRVEPAYPGVSVARLVDPPISIETAVVWRSGAESPLRERFVDVVRAVLGP